MFPLVGPLISAGASLLGGIFNRSSQEKANEQNYWMAIANMQAQERANAENRAHQTSINDANIAAARDINAASLADKNVDRELQREFAQSGVKWRVQDALEAGIHPVYALGGSGASYSPSAISLVAPTSQASPATAPQLNYQARPASMGSSLASMGQDISRAINATRSAAERDGAFTQTVQEMQLQNYTLRNQLLSAQIAKLRAGGNPPMPEVTGPPSPTSLHGWDSPEEVKPVRWAGGWIAHDRGASPAQSGEDRYGELADWTFGPYALWRDYISTHGGAIENRMSNPYDAGRNGSAIRRSYEDAVYGWKRYYDTGRTRPN